MSGLLASEDDTESARSLWNVLVALLALVALGPPRATAATFSGGPVVLALGSETTIPFAITPSADGAKGFIAFFQISDPMSIVVESCSSPDMDHAPVCPMGGSSFNFGVLDFTPAKTETFGIGSVTVMVPPTATVGATLSLTSQSSVTNGLFEEEDLSAALVARVPEPETPLLSGSVTFLVMAALRRGSSKRAAPSPRP